MVVFFSISENSNAKREFSKVSTLFEMAHFFETQDKKLYS